MTTKRSGSGQKKAAKATTSTATKRPSKTRELDSTEEKIVRMRRGLTVPADMPLERVGQAHPATRAKLLELEKRAFERSGRLDELRREVGLPSTKTDEEKKAKIISKLKKPAAKASGKAKAATKSKSR